MKLRLLVNRMLAPAGDGTLLLPKKHPFADYSFLRANILIPEKYEVTYEYQK